MSGLDLLISQRTYVIMLAVALATGIGMGVLYDLFRILRMALGDLSAWPKASAGQGSTSPLAKHFWRSLLRFVLDLLFILIVSVAFILLCYYTNDGQLRAPAVIGMTCGFFAYNRTVSRLVLALAAACLHLLKRLLITVGRITIQVLMCLFDRLLVRPAKGVLHIWMTLWRMTVGRLVAHRRDVLTDRRIRDICDRAAHGFPDR